MAGQPKMVIITSDENLIRQAFTSKTTDTQIIDLNKDEPHTSNSTVDNDTTIHRNLVAQLSDLHSKNDQAYKRALDVPNDDQSRPTKLIKGSVELICAVCGDNANGYNYDVLSCASCKAFFLRNANSNSKTLRCFTGQNQCPVVHGTYRRCPRCRLDRCLAVGMRRDFLLSDEAKKRRKKPVRVNRSILSIPSSTIEPETSLQSLSDLQSLSETLDEIDHFLLNLEQDETNTHNENIDLNEMKDLLSGTLSIDDWVTIQNLRSSFLSMFQIDNIKCFCVDVTDRTSALISWSYFVNKIVLSFIHFFRQIDEFENLNADDRFILVKYNISPVFPLFKCFTYKYDNDCCSYDDSEMSIKHRRFFQICGDSFGIRESFINLVFLLVDITGQDPTLLALLVTIFIFTHGLSMNEDEPLLKDSLSVHRAQCHYIELLWNYLISGRSEIQACKDMTKLLGVIFQIQSTCKNFQEFFRTQMRSPETVDRIAPVTQTVLHVS